MELAAQAELLDQGAIALEVVLLQVVQEAAPPADELQQPSARVVVVPVRAQMLRQLVDALRQHRYLHLRRAGVGLAAAVLVDDLLLGFLGKGHRASWSSSPGSPPAAPRKCTVEPGQGRAEG